MAEPTEAEIIEGAIRSWLDEVHTSMPGKVVRYDSAKQSADIQPAVQRAIVDPAGGWKHVDYPTIPACKVAWLTAGGCSLQMPLQAGDAVWLLFSEACWAQYRRTGQIAPAGDQRRFDLSYPVALPVNLVGALRNVTGPHLEVPDGQALTVGGNPAGMDFVAMSQKVSTELSRIQTDLTTLKSAVSTGLTAVGVSTAASGPAGAAAFNSAASAVPSSPGSVAAQKLKTE